MMRDLFAIVMLFGIYSLLSAAIFVTLDAVDVAFTEAAVGAGISTILVLSTLALTSREEKPPQHKIFLPLLVVLIKTSMTRPQRRSCHRSLNQHHFAWLSCDRGHLGRNDA